MVRAASTGRIDYASLDRRDRLHKAKEQLILNEIEREAWQDWMTVSHHQMIGMLGAQLSEEGRRSIQPVLEDVLNRVGKTMMPWERWVITDKDKAEVKELKLSKAKDDYERAFGTLKSAKVSEALQRARLFMLAERLVVRAKRERRKFNERQIRWIKDTVEAQKGNRQSWARVRKYTADDVIDLFEDVFQKKDLIADVTREFGAVT